MAVFHFCFDLSNFRLIQADFYRDPLWTTQRTCILSLFLLCAGAGQAVATHQGQTWARFWRRWAQVVGCALLVTLGSAWMFPRSFIYFGVLHGMAVMLIVARLSAPLGPWLWPLGAVALSLPRFFGAPFFDSVWMNWTGLVTHKPITEDYVPVLPWIGVMFWGLAATQWTLKHRPQWMSWAACPDTAAQAHRRQSGGGTCGDNTAPTRHPAPRPPMRLRQALVTLGQWSLTFYMVHQPVLIGLLQGWMALRGRPPH
ncbi:MAG: heparan-alpha-glucosaminide N-acetyltransferase [Aquabacterium sp.]